MPSLKKLLTDRKVLAWSLYDWANSAFATSVMAGFFPVFFKSYWSYGTTPEVSTSRLGYANAVASFLLAISSPFIGAICDRGGLNKILLGFFCSVGILATAALFFVDKGHWTTATFLYTLASIGFFSGNSLYDSLMPSVAKPQAQNQVSSLGFSLGYLGGGILLALNILMLNYPQKFGLAEQAVAVQFAFLTVALWWFAFSIPLFIYVPSPPLQSRKRFSALVIDSFTQVKRTLSSLRKQKNLMTFILAYFFYIDGIFTIIKMSVDYGLNMGLKSASLILALLLVQLVGFPAALIAGYLADQLGVKKILLGVILIYAVATLAATQMRTETHFFMLAFTIALVQGGAQALSRSAFSKMIPPHAAGEWFGFFNMIGKFSTIGGPILIAIAAPVVGARWSILAVLILFIVGFILLQKVEFEDE